MVWFNICGINEYDFNTNGDKSNRDYNDDNDNDDSNNDNDNDDSNNT